MRSFVESVVQKAPGASLLDIQIASLFEAWVADGLVASQGVGTGKTLVCLLLAVMLGCDEATFLIKKSLIRNLEREHEKWEPYFHIRPYKIVTYSSLQLQKNALLLDEMPTQLIVSDEAHKVKDPKAGRTRRLITKVVRDRPKFAALTGTLTTQSVTDYAHLSAMALKEGSPIPDFDESACLAWRRVMGHRPDPEDYDWPFVAPLCKQYGQPVTTEGGRNALREHLETTAGFVLTTEALCGASLVMTRIFEPRMPKTLTDIIENLTTNQVSPDGDPLTIYETDIISRQLQFGFWYKHTTTSPLDLVDEWRRAANIWGAAVKTWLSEGGQPGVDTPGLVREAARRGQLGQFGFAALDRFEAVEKLVKWDRETKWVWTGWVEAQHKWLQEHDGPAILWVRHQAVTQWLRNRGNVVYDKSPVLPLDAAGDPLAHKCVMSINTMQKGHNLQA